MKKWSQIWLAVACLAIFSSNTVSSQEYCHPEECCWKPIRHACYELGADFLYLKPCVSDLEFCGKRTTRVDNEVTKIDYCTEKVCPCWEPGVRVFFDYPDLFCWCNIGLRLSWTFTELGTKTSHGPGDLICPILHNGLTTQTLTDVEVDAEYSARYHEWEALLYYHCSCNKCTYITPYIGAAGLILKQDFDVNMVFDGGTANVDWDSDFAGAGLRAGIDFVYDHSPCLTFYGFANGSILAAHQHTKNEQDIWGIAEVELKLKDPSGCLCVPGFHIGVGARANICLCGWDFAMRGGYEFLQWHNLPKHKAFLGDDLVNGVGRSTTGTRTLGFHGPFLGLILFF